MPALSVQNGSLLCRKQTMGTGKAEMVVLEKQRIPRKINFKEKNYDKRCIKRVNFIITVKYETNCHKIAVNKNTVFEDFF